MKRTSQTNGRPVVLLRHVCVILLIVMVCLVLGACQKQASITTAGKGQEQTATKAGEQPNRQTTGLLTGKWTGKYYYEDGKSVDFSGTAQQTGDNISGQFTEPRTTFGPLMDAITFNLTGTIKNNQVTMIKTYAYNAAHKVNYSGTYYPSEKKIKGNWSIEKTTGTFEITIQN